MKTMIAVRVAASAMLACGGANAALAQAEFLDNLSAAVDLAQFANAVPPGTPLVTFVIRPATKQCPPTSDNTPTIILSAQGLAPPEWPAGATLNQSGFLCRISGIQCGFPGAVNATSSRLTIDRNGVVDLRCSANTTNP